MWLKTQIFAVLSILLAGKSLCEKPSRIIVDNNHYMKRRTRRSASYGDNEDLNKTIHVINIWVTVPSGDQYMFSKERVKPAIYRGLKDADATLCNSAEIADDRSRDSCYSVMMNDTMCDANFVAVPLVGIQDSMEGQCTSEGGSQQEANMNVFVGLTCDFAAGRAAPLADIWNWPAIFPGTRTTDFDNKAESCCEVVTRTGHTATDFGKFVSRVFNYYEWNTTFIVYSPDGNHGSHIHYDVKSDCSTFMAGVGRVFEADGWPWTADQKQEIWDTYLLDPDKVKDVLEKFRSNARVSLWCVGRKAMRNVMNVAYDLGMIGGDDPDERFAFFYFDLYNTNASYKWTDEDDQPCQSPAYCNTSAGNSTKGFEALQIISLYQPQTDEYEEFSKEIRSNTEPDLVGSDQFVNPFITQYYNSIRLLVNGVSRSIEEKVPDLSDGTAFTRRLWNTSFQSVDGLVTIDSNGDRMMDYTIMDMNNETGIFEASVVFFGSDSTWVNRKPIDWPGADPPPNIPPCGQYECVEPTTIPTTTPPYEPTSTVVIVTSSLLLVCAVLILLLMLRKYTNDRNVAKMMWKVRTEDLQFIKSKHEVLVNGSAASSVAGSEMNVSGTFHRKLFTEKARWKDQEVAVKRVKYVQRIAVDRKLQLEMSEMMSLNHEHLCKFIGASVEEPIVILTEFCSRGSLQDFLEDDTFGNIDDEVLRASLISDIANGMRYLHESPIVSHGNLKSSNCLLDSRLVVKITDFGLPAYRLKQRRNSILGYNQHRDLLWMAPELLRLTQPPVKGTKEGDVYSFAIVVQEIVYGKGAFYLGEESLTPTEICDRVKTIPKHEAPFRPTLEDDDDVIVSDNARRLMELCWLEIPEERPTFHQIASAMRKHTKKRNMIDSILNRLGKYTDHLREMVEEKTRQYKAQKERADTLLYEILPKPVADRLKVGQSVLPEKFEMVTIYFSDIVEFTKLSHKSTPLEVVEMLDSLYKTFDQVLESFDVYKVETIGDAYMVVSGLPDRNGNLHVREIARMALKLIEAVECFKIPHLPKEPLKLRVGIHSGPVVAGVVGHKMPRYCLFGDTVNTAARMEQSGKEMKIHISSSTKTLLDDFEGFVIQEREDEIYMKGLEQQKTWWLQSEESTAVQKSDLAINLPKKISSTSDYGSARSSFQDNVVPNRLQKFVTGVEDLPENLEEIVSNMRTSMVTYESEFVVRSHSPNERTHFTGNAQGRVSVDKKRRAATRGIPEELALEVSRQRRRTYHSTMPQNIPTIVETKFERTHAARKVRFQSMDHEHDNESFEPDEYLTRL